MVLHRYTHKTKGIRWIVDTQKSDIGVHKSNHDF